MLTGKSYNVRASMAVAPFPFDCALCKANVGAGFVLDRGKGQLDLVCPACVKHYVFVENFILPSSLPGLGLTELATKMES